MQHLPIKKVHLKFAAVVLMLPLAGYAEPQAVQDITHRKLENRDPHCQAYVGSYSSSVKDVTRGTSFKGSLTIKQEGNKCLFTSNSIPNHDFNDGSAAFFNPVKEVTEAYEISAEPKPASKPTPLSIDYDNGILLNGVKLDLLSAACYGVGSEPPGKEQIGCLTMAWGWRYDPMSPKNDFQADSHNAHAQPDGAYHYHGSPRALFEFYDTREGGGEKVPEKPSPVIGFAADGFPIYGPYISDKGKIRKVRSGYSLRKKDLERKSREHLFNERFFPGGNYDGTFREDWVFTGGGDLDECNGMLRDGQYGYYVTDSYPWVMGCFTGIPDGSFRKQEDGHAH